MAKPYPRPGILRLVGEGFGKGKNGLGEPSLVIRPDPPLKLLLSPDGGHIDVLPDRKGHGQEKQQRYTPPGDFHLAASMVVFRCPAITSFPGSWSFARRR